MHGSMDGVGTITILIPPLFVSSLFDTITVVTSVAEKKSIQPDGNSISHVIVMHCCVEIVYLVIVVVAVLGRKNGCNSEIK